MGSGKSGISVAPSRNSVSRAYAKRVELQVRTNLGLIGGRTLRTGSCVHPCVNVCIISIFVCRCEYVC